MIELTQEQHEALGSGTQPIRALDRATNTEYVLVRADVYDRLKHLLADETVYTTAEMLASAQGIGPPRAAPRKPAICDAIGLTAISMRTYPGAVSSKAMYTVGVANIQNCVRKGMT